MKNKRFSELTMIEMAEALIALKMPDGTKIEADTAKQSLARLIPILKHRISGDNDCLKNFTEQQITKDVFLLDWAVEIQRAINLIKKGEEVLAQPAE